MSWDMELEKRCLGGGWRRKCVLACIRRKTLAKWTCIEYKCDVNLYIQEKLKGQNLLQRCGWKGRAGCCF